MTKRVCEGCGAPLRKNNLSGACNSCLYEVLKRRGSSGPCNICSDPLPPGNNKTCNKCRYRARKARGVELQCQTCPSCGGIKAKGADRCLPCSGLARQGKPRSEDYVGRRITDGHGYIRMKVADWNRPGCHQGYVLEHRLVMEERLGRYLLSEENVHHKNGVRDDNRIENLELWTTSQPSGQRVEDKISWAKEILALYSEVYE